MTRLELIKVSKLQAYMFQILVLRTFALIVSVHPYCARNSCRNGTPRHTSSARLRNFLTKYRAGSRFVILEMTYISVTDARWPLFSLKKIVPFTYSLDFQKNLKKSDGEKLYSFFSFLTQKGAIHAFRDWVWQAIFPSECYFYQMEWHQSQIST